mmetsp:Transcript_13218/g.40638  ORF Transcript_13218/g.40638 Transcript_13218/m.40638 type:complete len:167 (+) Transcript_13218:168-668(+)
MENDCLIDDGLRDLDFGGMSVPNDDSFYDLNDILEGVEKVEPILEGEDVSRKRSRDCSSSEEESCHGTCTKKIKELEARLKELARENKTLRHNMAKVTAENRLFRSNLQSISNRVSMPGVGLVGVLDSDHQIHAPSFVYGFAQVPTQQVSIPAPSKISSCMPVGNS